MRTTFDLTKELRSAMETARAADGYSIRMKSRWISEAIATLSSEDRTFSSVGLSEGLTKANTKMPVTLTQSALDVIRRAKAQIRREDPESEGLTGQIIRAAIRNRLKLAKVHSVNLTAKVPQIQLRRGVPTK